MAEFIFVPSDVEHPTAEERFFLLRHIGHDIGGNTFTINNQSTNIRRGKCKNLKEAGSLIHALSFNLTQFFLALERLNWNSHSTEPRRISTFGNLRDYLQEQYYDLKWQLNIPFSSDLRINNLEVVWLQMLNFSQNVVLGAYESKRFTAILSLDQLTLSPKELAYLGRNQQQYTTTDHFIKASVQDFGQGIAPERLPHIIPRTKDLTIDPRRRAGLSLTDYVCDYLHGFVKVESELGKGSTFSLYFPQEYKPRRAPKQLELPFRSLSGPSHK